MVAFCPTRLFLLPALEDRGLSKAQNSNSNLVVVIFGRGPSRRRRQAKGKDLKELRFSLSLRVTFGVNCASVFSSRIAASLIFCSLRIFHVKPSGRWIFAISILWAFSVVSLKINRIEEKEKKSDVFVFTHSLL